ncbi:MAG: peptide deformylase [Ruminococcus sp.]|nr:peptide deformylase [Ruminococcus sp.]
MVKEIIKDTEFLSQSSVPATKDDMQVVRDLLDTLEANSERCVGLAANMIGVSKTILAATIGDKNIVMINPKIVDHSKEPYETEEACLSLSGTRSVKRYQVITVEYCDKKFKRRKQIFRDFEAEIIQHEIDHFSGILI